MLHEFLTANRDELIRRCKLKVSRRGSPLFTAIHPDYGVSTFLEQLGEALRYEDANPTRKHNGEFITQLPPGLAEGSRTAALHGKALLEQGYSVDQVVHSYGDLCQAVTELATERNAVVTVEEFHTLNRLLDNAIADAVSSFGIYRDAISHQAGMDIHDRMGTLAEEQRVLLDRAIKALDALKVGNVGLLGATGTLLEDSLMKLRDLIDRSLPEIRVSSGMISTPDRLAKPLRFGDRRKQTT